MALTKRIPIATGPNINQGERRIEHAGPQCMEPCHSAQADMPVWEPVQEVLCTPSVLAVELQEETTERVPLYGRSERVEPEPSDTFKLRSG